MKPTFDLRRWRATTALCVASVMAVAPVASAADGSIGRSSWDHRVHRNPYTVVQDILQKISDDANGKRIRRMVSRRPRRSSM